jgi:phosphopantetheine adenylyltransferase/dephospho-CoA kinase
MSTSLIKAKSSLLFLTQTLADLKTNLKYLLEESFKKTNENLYIYINPIRKQEDSVTNYKSSSLKITYLCNERYQLKLILNQFYQSSFKLNPNINVTCLLSNIHTYSNKASRHQLDYDLILTDWLIRPDQGDDLKLTQFLNTKITNLNQKEIPINSIDCNENKNPRATVWPNETPSDHDELFKNGTFENSIMGGTFDRIHNGHKIMLSEAVLLTRNRLLIGMTSESMLKKKKLAELIQSFDVRCENLKKFLKDVNPDLEVLTPMLMDPFGPSIVEPDYQVIHFVYLNIHLILNNLNSFNLKCLIVSRETFKSGEMLNTKRLENHLSELKIHVVELMSENKEGENDDGDEDKISSSNERRRLLGTLLRPPYISYNPSKPYVIGLTGGLASGKSAIRGDLEKLGAGINQISNIYSYFNLFHQV